MGKPFDLSKFRKDISKSIEGMSIGFHDPTDWVSTGNYALNYLISGDFNRGIPLGQVTVFAGESGAGKSYICSGNVIKNAQAQGIYVVLIDSENALDEAWLKALGVDTGEDKLLKLNMAMIDDVGKTISTFMKDYKALDAESRPKVLFVIDSLGMLMTNIQVDQFEAGNMKGDMGHKPRALKSLVTNCVNMFGSCNVGMIATNHSYESQDPYSPDPKISGGSGFVYASSIVVAMKKLKLKEDEAGNKVTDVLGIRAGCKIMKTRYAKPFEDIQIQIPYETGMNPYSGMFDLIEKRGLISKEGNRYCYTDLNGEVHKYFRKEWAKNENGILDTVMGEFAQKDQPVVNTDNEMESDE
jgi:recombination protein RecA